MENLSKDDVLAHYNGPHRWLKDNILFLTVHGSRAYGTNNENSDIDIKGIAIPDKEYLLGFKNNFEQTEIREPYDVVIYSLQKFCKLASDCNPSIIEILFTDPKEWIYASPLYLKLYENRHLFLSKKVKNTFVGYALSQLKRAKTHREWLLNPPNKKPSREDFNLPVNKKVNISTQGAIEEMISSGITFDADIMTRFQQEKKYLASLNNWKQYENWKQTRNKSRAIMEDKMGFDSKNAMHLIRLLNMGEEILNGKGVLTKRPDAQFLKDIRNGSMTYNQIIDLTEEKKNKIDEAYLNSALPEESDKTAIDSICVEITEEFLFDKIICG